jgi:hypothetical protein
MPMTPEEKSRVLDMLDRLDEAERAKALTTFQRFVEWVRSVFSDIYSRIASALESLWYILFG